MKYVITESQHGRLKNYMISYFDILFQPDSIHYTHPYVYDYEGNETEDRNVFEFYYGNYMDEDFVFTWYGSDYYDEDEDYDLKVISPIVQVAIDRSYELDGIFGEDKWEETFKEWFKETFGLDVKTVK
jgi:hypothetical protein